MLRNRILTAIREIAAENGSALVEPFAGSTVLLESGLDSIDFATLVARLDEELGFDPFAAMSTPYYPRTLDDFVRTYEEFNGPSR